MYACAAHTFIIGASPSSTPLLLQTTDATIMWCTWEKPGATEIEPSLRRKLHLSYAFSDDNHEAGRKCDEMPKSMKGFSLLQNAINPQAQESDAMPKE